MSQPEERMKPIDKLLLQAKINRVLDLTNLHLTLDDEQKIKQFFYNSPPTQVRMLGLQPSRIEHGLSSFIEQYNIDHADSQVSGINTHTLNETLTADFNVQFRQLAINKRKVSMRFEPSRLGAALKKGFGALLKQLWQEIKGNVPKFGGMVNFSNIKTVKKLNNDEITDRYKSLSHQTPPLPSVLSDSLSTMRAAETELEAGEMLLFHGTSVDVAPLIMNSGFDEQRCKFVKGNGYGPLGKGVYFTNELAKAATFANCSICGLPGECDCIDPETQEPADRVVLLCKVFVGNPEIIGRKGDIRERTEPSSGFDSTISLASDIDSNSAFRSTEVCVPSGKQAIPLYEIKFKSQPNFLKPGIFEKRVSSLKKQWLPKGAAESLDEIKKLLDLYQRTEDIDSHTVERFQIMEEVHLRGKQLLAEAESLLKIYQNIKPPPKETDKKLVSLNRYIQDLSLLNYQVNTTKGLYSHVLPEPSKDFGLHEIKRSTGKKLILKIASFLISKEFVLKKLLDSKIKSISSYQSNPSLLSDFQQLLSLAIERDQAKGLHLFTKNSYPFHRAYLTNTMLKLRMELASLNQDSTLSPNQKKHHLLTLINSALDISTTDEASHKKIQHANSYDLLMKMKHALETELANTADESLIPAGEVRAQDGEVRAQDGEVNESIASMQVTGHLLSEQIEYNEVEVEDLVDALSETAPRVSDDAHLEVSEQLHIDVDSPTEVERSAFQAQAKIVLSEYRPLESDNREADRLDLRRI